SEPLTPEFQQRFEQDMEMLTQPALTRGQRWYYRIFLGATLLNALNAVAVLILVRDNPPVTVLGAFMLVVSILAGGFIVHMLRRGSEDFPRQQAIGKLLPGIALAITCGLLMICAGDWMTV